MNTELFARLETGEGYSNTRENNVLNPWMNFHDHEGAQSLVDVLTSEAIQARGVEAVYLKRESKNLDLIFGEDPTSKFNTVRKFSMYVQTFDSYQGQRDFFSKFGYQVNDEMTVQVNPSSFTHQVGLGKPREGDLIYFPMDNILFEINWVEPDIPFRQTGVRSVLTLTAQRFIYSGEEISPEIATDDITAFDVTEESTIDNLRNLDGLSDIFTDEFAEKRQTDEEAGEYVEEFMPIQGKGSPFADDL